MERGRRIRENNGGGGDQEGSGDILQKNNLELSAVCLLVQINQLVQSGLVTLGAHNGIHRGSQVFNSQKDLILTLLLSLFSFSLSLSRSLSHLTLFSFSLQILAGRTEGSARDFSNIARAASITG